jgi:hypothetical protein
MCKRIGIVATMALLLLSTGAARADGPPALVADAIPQVVYHELALDRAPVVIAGIAIVLAVALTSAGIRRARRKKSEEENCWRSATRG